MYVPYRVPSYLRVYLGERQLNARTVYKLPGNYPTAPIPTLFLTLVLVLILVLTLTVTSLQSHT